MADEQSAARYLAVRKSLALSQSELAKALKIKKQTISSWERGVSDPRIDTARQLAELAGVHVEWLLSGRGSNGVGASNVVDYIGRGRKVPKMGDTETRIVSLAKRRPTEFVQTHYECSAKAYALQVVGGSMAEEFQPGDVVIIDPELIPIPGDFVQVDMDDGRTLFRQYRPIFTRKGSPPAFELIACNKNWHSERVDADNPGKVKGVMSERIVPRRRM